MRAKKKGDRNRQRGREEGRQRKGGKEGKKKLLKRYDAALLWLLLL